MPALENRHTENSRVSGLIGNLRFPCKPMRPGTNYILDRETEINQVTVGGAGTGHHVAGVLLVPLDAWASSEH